MAPRAALFSATCSFAVSRAAVAAASLASSCRLAGGQVAERLARGGDGRIDALEVDEEGEIGVHGSCRCRASVRGTRAMARQQRP